MVDMTTIAELNDLAKDFFSNVYVNTVNPETPLRAQFESLEGAMFTGRKWIFGVKLEYGGGASNAGANRTLPAATEGQFDQGEANVVRTYTTMALDGLVIEVTKNRAGSYRPALAEVMQDRMTAHEFEQNRQLYGAGKGVVAIVDVDGGTTQTLRDDYGVSGAGPGARHIYAGDQVRFYDPTLVTLRGPGTVTVDSVDLATNDIVVSADPVTTAGDVITKATDDDDNVTTGETNGLLASVDDSSGAATFETIPSSGRWQSFKLGNSGTPRPVSDSLVMQTIETIRHRSRQIPNLVVTTPGIVLKYSEIFLPLRRLDGQSVQLRGGYKPLAAIMHAGGAIPVVSDTDCPKGNMFFLNTGSFRMADLIGTEWSQIDGATFDRLPNQDAITGYIRKYWQLITVFRNANGRLFDLEDIASIERRFG